MDPAFPGWVAERSTQWQTKKQQPMLFVDGVREVESVSDINPAQIEAMELYQGASEVPAEAKGDACAAIFIWLKAGR